MYLYEGARLTALQKLANMLCMFDDTFIADFLERLDEAAAHAHRMEFAQQTQVLSTAAEIIRTLMDRGTSVVMDAPMKAPSVAQYISYVSTGQ